MTEIKTIICNIRKEEEFQGKNGPGSQYSSGTIYPRSNRHNQLPGKVNMVAPEVPSQLEIGCGTDIPNNISVVTFGVRRNTVPSSFFSKRRLGSIVGCY